MRKKEQLELTRRNVTPAQFLAYVRHQIRKHNFTSILADDINFEYWKNGGDLEFDYHDVVGKPCKAEKSVSQPYKMQTYILNWDGTVYNLIAEFEFDDDKKGWGYFYFVNTWDIEEPEEPETAEGSKEEKGENTMFEKIADYINTIPCRSAWRRGVRVYALELLEELEEHFDGGYITEDVFTDGKKLEKALLNGADNWEQYSWGGCSLIYNGDIAERLCTPSELKRTRGGEWRPNRNEEWLDCQARALFQAARMIRKAANAINKGVA